MSRNDKATVGCLLYLIISVIVTVFICIYNDFIGFQAVVTFIAVLFGFAVIFQIIYDLFIDK